MNYRGCFTARCTVFCAYLLSVLFIAFILPLQSSASEKTKEPTKPKAYLDEFSDQDFLTQKKIEWKAGGDKPLVVVFLSSLCPCSNSHIGEVKSLAQEYSEVTFVGVHANQEESVTSAGEYFKQAGLPFPVVRDSSQKWTNHFKALRTPHAFIISPMGELLYKGAVSDSREFSRSEQKFLRLALADLKNKREIKIKDSRPLGCQISR